MERNGPRPLGHVATARSRRRGYGLLAIPPAEMIGGRGKRPEMHFIGASRRGGSTNYNVSRRRLSGLRGLRGINALTPILQG